MEFVESQLRLAQSTCQAYESKITEQNSQLDKLGKSLGLYAA